MSAVDVAAELDPTGKPDLRLYKGAVPDLDTDALKGMVVVQEREGGVFDAFVPVELVDNKEVPVKEEWAKSLAKDMKRKASDRGGGNGQITAITLAQISGEKTLKIADGFHRSAALKRNGETTIYAAVMPMTWDELYDMRILTAKDHAHVRFSRVVQWIQETWARHPLSAKISAQQAFSLKGFDSVGGKLGITSEEATEVKEWVADKEDKWEIAAMTVHSYLAIAEHVDPKLVHTAREKGSGRNLDAPTQTILKVFSQLIPGDFELQNLAMQTAIDHNLKSPQVKGLCQTIVGLDIDAAALLIANVSDWKNFQSSYGESKSRQLRRASDPSRKGDEVFTKAEDIVERILERTAKLDPSEVEDPQSREKLLAAQAKARELARMLGKLSGSIDMLLGKEPAPQHRSKEEPRGIIIPPAPKVRVGVNVDTSRRPRSTKPDTSSPGQSSERANAADQAPRAAQAEQLASKLKDYLDGKLSNMPAITSRADVRTAEELLSHGKFSGAGYLQDDVREAIADCRAQSKR